MSWKLDSVPEPKVWKIFANVSAGSPVTTANLNVRAQAFLDDWKKSFPSLDTLNYSLLAARKGTMETFIYFECKEGIYFSNFISEIQNSVRTPMLLRATHSGAFKDTPVSYTYSNDYGIYNGLTVTGAPFTAEQTYPTIDAMKVALEGLGYTVFLKKNVGQVAVPTGIVVNTNYSQPLRYTAIESASQLINAILNRQSLQEILAIDKTGFSRTYYDVVYTLSYMVQQRNLPKYVT